MSMQNSGQSRKIFSRLKVSFDKSRCNESELRMGSVMNSNQCLSSFVCSLSLLVGGGEFPHHCLLSAPDCKHDTCRILTDMKFLHNTYILIFINI